jgi:single-stranded-DNA-specific exonuclease
MKIVQGKKYLWKIASVDYQQALELAASYNLSLPIAQTVLARGFSSKEAIDSYLFTSYEKEVAHPSLLKDAQKSVDRIVDAINKKEKILIAGDYDVDGITSSALMMICLMPLGADVNFFLPHRVRDGYGLSSKVVQRAGENNYKVIITVDNGITAFEPAQKAKELGIDLIITDHHRPHDQVPEAFAIVNPHQQDCPYPYKKFAGVGVSFKILSLLYEKLGLTLPAKAYELLLLGTVADVVPLTGENRYWVRHGLNYINSVESNSLKVLKQNGNVMRSNLSATDIGFSITPQINALGRLEDAREGVKFLIGSDISEVEKVGRTLFELNQARKEIERSIFADVKRQIDSNAIDVAQENIIIAASQNWPPGVIGLVASRLLGAYGKPTLLFHLTKDGMAKGSCRSIPEFNMFDALHEARHLLTTFGGHSVAAGLALPIDNIALLKKHLEELIVQKVTVEDLQQKIILDAEIKLPDLNTKFMKDMDYLQPFGNENHQPTFYLKNVALIKPPILMKDLHVKCSVFADGVIKPVVFFNRPEIFEMLMQQKEQPFDLAVQVTQNYWNDKITLELVGHDIAQRQSEL